LKIAKHAFEPILLRHEYADRWYLGWSCPAVGNKAIATVSATVVMGQSGRLV